MSLDGWQRQGADGAIALVLLDVMVSNQNGEKVAASEAMVEFPSAEAA